jgi:ADP-ribosylglycohydrolase
MKSLALAWQSLVGLSVGDAFGQCFFLPEYSAADFGARTLPESPWLYTDDTEMALTVFAVLAKFGHVQQDELAQSLAHSYHYDRAYLTQQTQQHAITQINALMDGFAAIWRCQMNPLARVRTKLMFLYCLRLNAATRHQVTAPIPLTWATPWVS